MPCHREPARSSEHDSAQPCDSWSRLRLAGLVPSLLSNLVRRRGERIQVQFECASTHQEATGVLADAGLGFVTVVNRGLATMVPLNRLCAVKWAAPDPSDPSGHLSARRGAR